jgi:hypothetical protein
MVMGESVFKSITDHCHQIFIDIHRRFQHCQVVPDDNHLVVLDLLGIARDPATFGHVVLAQTGLALGAFSVDSSLVPLPSAKCLMFTILAAMWYGLYEIVYLKKIKNKNKKLDSFL